MRELTHENTPVGTVVRVYRITFAAPGEDFAVGTVCVVTKSNGQNSCHVRSFEGVETRHNWDELELIDDPDT